MTDALNEARKTSGAAPVEEARTASGPRIFTGQLFRVRDRHGWGFTEEAPAPSPAPVRRPARVAQMLALAHRLQAEIDRGDFRDRADLARQLGFTRARVSQLLDLLMLAPDLQEHILGLEAVDGVEPLSERTLRDVVRHQAWAEQRMTFDAQVRSTDLASST
jgi:hypothetical protein